MRHSNCRRRGMWTGPRSTGNRPPFAHTSISSGGHVRVLDLRSRGPQGVRHPSEALAASGHLRVPHGTPRPVAVSGLPDMWDTTGRDSVGASAHRAHDPLRGACGEAGGRDAGSIRRSTGPCDGGSGVQVENRPGKKWAPFPFGLPKRFCIIVPALSTLGALQVRFWRNSPPRRGITRRSGNSTTGRPRGCSTAEGAGNRWREPA